jgi:putative heme-binding domain-containing protein
LTEAGALGPERLLLHVLDPNRNVDPDYYTTTIGTQDGEDHDGIIVRDNKNGVMLRTMGGEVFIKTADISGRRLTGRSLMPVGFESMGGDGLRDLLAYMCAGRENYRIIDLQPAFTADSRKGLWGNESDEGESLSFKNFGLVKEGDVPFEIVNPLKFGAGKNVVVLKGGPAKSQPQSVEVPKMGVKAVKLDFLGGIGAGAYPAGGEGQKDIPVAKVTVHYADGQSEEIILKNGMEIGDWKTAAALPGANDASDLLRQGVLRWFTKTLAHPGVIQSLTLESFGNDVAPAFVAITAETGVGSASAK